MWTFFRIKIRNSATETVSAHIQQRYYFYWLYDLKFLRLSTWAHFAAVWIQIPLPILKSMVWKIQMAMERGDRFKAGVAARRSVPRGAPRQTRAALRRLASCACGSRYPTYCRAHFIILTYKFWIKYMKTELEKVLLFQSVCTFSFCLFST